MPDEDTVRKYNPDFIVALNGESVIIEVKTERAGKNGPWLDYAEKARVKQAALAKYATETGVRVFWCTQRDVKKYYAKVLKERRACL